MTRVVVVGSGIGGCLAALSAKRERPNASVRLVSTAPERYTYEPGTIGVLGYTQERTKPVEMPLFEVRKLPEDHPYSLVGTDRINEALSYFDELLEGDEALPYLSGGNRTALVPTLNGTVRPVSRYPAGVAGGVASSQREMHIVGIEQLTHLDAALAGHRLDLATPYDVDWSTVDVPLEPTEHPSIRAFATALDENRKADDETPIRERLANAVRPALDIEPRVGFPAILGLDDHQEVRRDLESLLQAEVFEIPIGEPNLPGLRLRDRLFDRVEAAGVERIESRVTTIQSENGSVQTLHLAEGERSNSEEIVEGDAFVLATGDFAAGGLVSTGDDIVEPVFDCPITHPDSYEEWSAPEALGDHPFARFGVDVSESLQPTDTDGEPLYDNLFAAGTVLGGYNFVREHSRGGVAIVTGYEAGRRAADR